MATRYRDYGYRSPDPSGGEAQRALTATIARLASACAPAGTVCDLGCGNGYLASQLAARGHRIVGVDASESGLEVARHHHGREGVSFILADLESPSVAQSVGAGRFDVVVSSDVVEHLYRPAALVEAAHALLVPGGWLVVGTPYHGWLKNVAISALDRWDAHHAPNWDGGHIKFFSPATLGALVEGPGFRVQRFHYHGRIRWLWKNMICVARKHAG
jgi:2-polyprenyl-3-methyl-5-hydroxy-6-metoxy-1,4-benzoquinol methylase